MTVLSIDCSAVCVSTSLLRDGEVIKSEFLNTGLTHSETLVPMVKKICNSISYSDIDKISVTVGPGSFTGVRIGVAVAKGIAFCNNTPCVGVSTLLAIAYNFCDKEAVVCSVMDARRNQFYNALFKCSGGVVSRLTEDRAISIDDLRKELKNYESVIIAGDGAKLCHDNLGLDNCVLADESKIFQNAVSVAHAASKSESVSPEKLVPVYLRPSQAERELKLKLNSKNKD